MNLDCLEGMCHSAEINAWHLLYFFRRRVCVFSHVCLLILTAILIMLGIN